MSVTVGGATARRDGVRVASLTYGGKVVTVKDLSGRVIGRLLRMTDEGAYRYDAWTALHEGTMVPSDHLLAEDLPIGDAVDFILQHAAAA